MGDAYLRHPTSGANEENRQADQRHQNQLRGVTRRLLCQHGLQRMRWRLQITSGRARALNIKSASTTFQSASYKLAEAMFR